MYINQEKYAELKNEAEKQNATLVAVSKTKPVEAILELYQLGHRDFGENYVQEVVEKEAKLPKDIRWHFIGHLQTNKAKYLASFVYLIHGVDSFKLLKEIDKQAAKNKRVIQILLQVHIAEEETKFGLDEQELAALYSASGPLASLQNIKVKGLMGMASFSNDQQQVQKEFRHLKSLYDTYATYQIPNSNFETLSMGMSGDYQIALHEGSSMLRIGSLIFGSRG